MSIFAACIKKKCDFFLTAKIKAQKYTFLWKIIYHKYPQQDRRASSMTRVLVVTITWTLRPLRSLYDIHCNTNQQSERGKRYTDIIFRSITVIYVLILDKKCPFKYNDGAKIRRMFYSALVMSWYLYSLFIFSDYKWLLYKMEEWIN